MDMNTDQELSIDIIDTRWPWRVGWPRLRPQRMLTFPVSPEVVNQTASSLEALGERIDEILGAYSISHRDKGSLVHRTNEKFRNNRPREHLRILVDCIYNAQKHQETPSSWAKATIDIQKAMREILGDHHEIGIELCDYQIEHSLRATDFPSGTSKFQKNWSRGFHYRRKVHSIFNRHQGLWQTIFPTGMEASNEQCKIHECVLWIDAFDADDPAWPPVEEKLRSLLAHAGVSVEIWQSSGFIRW